MIDNELGADLRALLAQGRDHLGPDAATIARLRSRIDTAVTAAPAAAAKALGVKLTLVAVTVTAAASVYRFVDTHHDIAAPASPQIAVADPDLEIETGSSIASQEPSPAPKPVSAAPAPEPVSAAPRQAPPVAVEPTVEPTAAAPPPEPGISLAREIELVDRASLALRRRDLAAAVQALHTYADETQGKGQLAQDAGAIEVEVLCRQNDPNAAAQLAAFQHRWPRSAHTSHLRATCAHHEETKP